MEDVGIDERIILKRIFKMWVGDIDWIAVEQDMER